MMISALAVFLSGEKPFNRVLWDIGHYAIMKIMFDLGIQELIVIFIVALVVFGPDKLPEVGRVLGKGIGDLQRALRGAKDELDTEVNKVKDELKDIKDPLELKNQLFSSNDLFASDTKRPAPAETAVSEAQCPVQDKKIELNPDAEEARLAEKQRVLKLMNERRRGTGNV
ncbi:MAG TPA: twin-arginine translocase TatA/TatE family subunit [Dissulfurispiraceae bacterium]|nr:twin-arginine translocase TatA/TatE family subunit [Dissulfurispiraceae bacterium]